MRFYLILILSFFVVNCITSTQKIVDRNTITFNLFHTNDTINLNVSYFSKNNASCGVHAIPYALLIGQTSTTCSSNIPKTITVLAWCDTQDYRVGQNIKVIVIQDPTTRTGLQPLYKIKDTLIHNQKHKWVLGSEYPAIWGKVL